MIWSEGDAKVLGLREAGLMAIEENLNSRSGEANARQGHAQGAADR